MHPSTRKNNINTQTDEESFRKKIATNIKKTPTKSCTLKQWSENLERDIEIEMGKVLRRGSGKT